jgi:Zn-dependent protease with chaperone function
MVSLFFAESRSLYHRPMTKAFWGAVILLSAASLSQGQISRNASTEGWYKQHNYYQSPAARVVGYDKPNNRYVTMLQITPEYELQMGENSFKTLSAQAPMLNDMEFQGTVDRIVQRLKAATPGPNLPLQVSVQNVGDINALAMPGHIVIYAGLLRATQSEAQLAGVLAHELGHIYGHHMSRQITKMASLQMVANAALSAVDQQNRLGLMVGQLAAGWGLNLFRLAYSRFEEKEADIYGAHILYNAGYNPTAMSEYMLGMYRMKEKQPVKLLSTHPPSQDRASYLTTYLEKFKLDGELQTDSNAFQTLRARFVRDEAPRPVLAATTETPVSGMMPPTGVRHIAAEEPVVAKLPQRAASGRIVWKGNLRSDELLTIGRGYADKGTVDGQFPTGPFTIRVMTPDVTVMEAAGTANNWGRFSILSRKKQSVVEIEWRLAQ